MAPSWGNQGTVGSKGPEARGGEEGLRGCRVQGGGRGGGGSRASGFSVNSIAKRVGRKSNSSA